MMFNPSSQVVLPEVGDLGMLPLYVGGQHSVYVTNTAYDECATFRENFKAGSNPLIKVRSMREIIWAGMWLPPANTSMSSYAAGLIPEKTTVKLRVTNPYQVEQDIASTTTVDERTGSGENNYHPLYRFSIDGAQADPLDQLGIENALDKILVVPNPYYGFSNYETSQFTTTVKITNLPPKCTVTIFTLDGKFIRQYTRDEVGAVPEGRNRAIARQQITPALEWDLNNSKGIPIASGVYLIHVQAEGLGERTLKWFGLNRQFDPSGL